MLMDLKANFVKLPAKEFNFLFWDRKNVQHLFIKRLFIRGFGKLATSLFTWDIYE